MHRFCNFVYKHDTFYKFKLDKKKRFKLNLEVFRDIFQICPRVPGRDFDALPFKEANVSFLRELGNTEEINSLNNVVVDRMHQPWRTFVALINRDKTLSWRNKIRMHTSKDDYLISTLRFVSANESTQIYGAILPECLTSPAMKESKAYKTYLGYATGVVPPKIARKFKKSSPSKKDSIVIREPHVEAKSKRKEKVDVTRGKGIKLLYEVALTKEAQMKEVRKKILREFHKLHPSGSSTAAEKPPRVDTITLPVTKSWGNKEDDRNDENDSENKVKDEETKSDDDKTPFDSEKDSDSEQDTNGCESDSESDQQEYDEEIKDNDEVKEDMKMMMMMISMKEKENLKINQEVVEDAHVTIMTVAKETEVPDASGSHSSDLASKFLNFLNIPPNDVEIVSPLDVHVHHEVSRIHTSTLFIAPVSVIPEASPDPLHTQVTALVDGHLDTRMRATREEFMNFLSASLTGRITEQVRNQLPQILLEEVSNFAPPMIEKMITESLNQVNLAKASSQPQSTYKAAATLTEFELKNNLIDKINSIEPYLTASEHRECYDGLIKSYNLDKDFFSSYDVYSLKRSQQDKDKDEGPFAGSDRGLKKRKTSKDAETTTSSKTKDSTSKSSKGTKSQPKSSGKYVYSEEPEFEVRDTNTPQVLIVMALNYSCFVGDDVADFVIALRMFTRSQVIQKRVEDLQLGVKSYQKQINVTKPDTTRPDLRKRLLHYQEYRHGVLDKEKIEYIEEEKSSLYDQGHQQAAKGKEDDEKFGEICWW
nr:hypothetical protein [Tanacetum cinerariifolium]